jgi:hypothetical protein
MSTDIKAFYQGYYPPSFYPRIAVSLYAAERQSKRQKMSSETHNGSVGDKHEYEGECEAWGQFVAIDADVVFRPAPPSASAVTRYTGLRSF